MESFFFQNFAFIFKLLAKTKKKYSMNNKVGFMQARWCSPSFVNTIVDWFPEKLY